MHICYIMPKTKAVSVSLEPAYAAFVEACVRLGQYSSRSATIAAAVKLLMRSEKARIAKSPAAQIERAMRIPKVKR